MLNLYAGVGGNIELLDENLFEITNVEWNPKIANVLQVRKPNQIIIVADAHQYLLDHYSEFDFIWASRPCQKHTRMVKFTRHKKAQFIDGGLFEEIIFLKHFFKGKWVVENVIPYYDILMNPKKIDRHLFWSNFEIPDIEVPKKPMDFINSTTVKGKLALMEWLGIHYDENIYYEGNHCPAQILRNCVHPKIGKQIMDAYIIQCSLAHNKETV